MTTSPSTKVHEEARRRNERPHLRALRGVSPGILALALVAVSCISLMIVALALRPPPIHSHEDQIADVLRRDGIAYSQISLGERWPDHINFQYGANVFPYGYRITIRMADGTLADGSLQCAELERRCDLTVRSLNLRAIPLRDITVAHPLPMPAWLERYLMAEVLP